ncbi:hypothetical protein VNI00_012521 [Paramarasmius palmivorus]|uniref:Uncharacterized protein n=1 Tax=Paramarasmius palmivorus TaxID=297713 RepID=A0AAW0C6Z5_9AGAR
MGKYDTYAVYSGYTMPPDKFIEFVESLPLKVKWKRRDGDRLAMCVSNYLSWRRRLTRREEMLMTPVARFHYKPKDPGVNRPLIECVEGIFMSVRGVRYRSPQQLERTEENRRLWEENDMDRAKLERFIQLVQKKGGSLDTTGSQFGAIKSILIDY